MEELAGPTAPASRKVPQQSRVQYTKFRLSRNAQKNSQGANSRQIDQRLAARDKIWPWLSEATVPTSCLAKLWSTLNIETRSGSYATCSEAGSGTNLVATIEDRRALILRSQF